MAAFTKATFSGNVGAGSAAPSLYVYGSIDTKAVLIASGYFNDIAGILKVGDQINVTFDTDGTPGLAPLYVASNDGTTVTTGYAVIV